MSPMDGFVSEARGSRSVVMNNEIAVPVTSQYSPGSPLGGWVSLQVSDVTNAIRGMRTYMGPHGMPWRDACFYAVDWNLGVLPGQNLVMTQESPTSFYSNDKLKASVANEPELLMIRCSHGGFAGEKDQMGDIMGVIVRTKDLREGPGQIRVVTLMPPMDNRKKDMPGVTMCLALRMREGRERGKDGIKTRGMASFHLMVNPQQSLVRMMRVRPTTGMGVPSLLTRDKTSGNGWLQDNKMFPPMQAYHFPPPG